jgi:hypothetical protein
VFLERTERLVETLIHFRRAESGERADGFASGRIYRGNRQTVAISSFNMIFG